jgi:uncharacterized membrane protein
MQQGARIKKAVIDRLTWRRAIALVMAVAFTVVFFWLTNRQYLAFSVRGGDVDRFSQAIWNALHGRFLYSTIQEESILANHFSPIMALLSPLLLVWSDVRILYLVQLLGIALTGLILFKVVEEKRPTLALFFLAAFYLNPALHQVALLELRRVTLAMPFLALALYGLHRKHNRLMVIGLFFALLCKEDLGLVVAMMGVYLLALRRDWRRGLPLLFLGFAWTASMVLWIIPAFGREKYGQLNYFAGWGDSMGEILATMLSSPGQVLQAMFDRDSLIALWRLSIPFALVLPLLGFDYLFLSFPLFALLLLSTDRAMHRLDRWYLAPVLPIIYYAVAAGLNRLPNRLSRWCTAALLAGSLVGFALYSEAPLGGRFDPNRFRVTERGEQAWELIRQIPESATVVAQAAFTIALAQREEIYMFPWVPVPAEEIDYYVVAEGFNPYPLTDFELMWEIRNLVADPSIVVETEVDNIFILRRGIAPLPAFRVDRAAEGSIYLDRVELAMADEEGFFQTADKAPVSVRQGQELRITLYWRALAAPEAERTVSVRVTDSTGALAAQHDTLPGESSRPTSWWEPGWYFRDVYYLTVAPDAAPGPATLDVLLYDTYSGTWVPFEEDSILNLLELEIVEQTAGSTTAPSDQG